MLWNKWIKYIGDLGKRKIKDIIRRDPEDFIISS